MWNDTRNKVPEKDGMYMAQTAVGGVTTMSYTVEGGWNTSSDENGNVDDAYALNNMYVVRWYEVEEPESVPKEWFEEWLRTGSRKGEAK